MNQFKQLDDSVYLGPQSTGQDLRQARQREIKTVIDFRLPVMAPAPNAALAARNGLDYVNIPVNKMNLSKGQIDELDRVMREKDGPFLIHCATGVRAAMLVSLSKARKNHWAAERTFEEARAMGFDLKTPSEFVAFVNATTPFGY